MESTSSESVFSQLEELLIEEACAISTDAKSHALNKARAILEDALIDDPHNPELYHAMGICWYHEPGWSDEARASIEQCFRKALGLEPQHQFVSLYLGHFCFDQRRYEEAL